MDMMMGFLMLTTHIDGGCDHDDQNDDDDDEDGDEDAKMLQTFQESL